MSNKTLQEQRMRSYFIESTKQIIKGEGMAAVSARNIADRAGYSYATLYNYFADIKELMFVCVSDFRNECADAVRAGRTASGTPADELWAVVRGMIHYFMQYQGVFELFFLERVTGPGWNAGTIDLICNLLPELCGDVFDRCLKEGLLDKAGTELLGQDLNHAVTGLLLFYLARHRPSDYNAFMTLAESQVRRLCRNSIKGI